MTSYDYAKEPRDEHADAPSQNSSRPCGCDPGANHKCEWHAGLDVRVEEAKTRMGVATGEVRVTDAVTGGQKGSKLARFSLIPRDFLWALAEHYGRGAAKYDDRNWERGYKWSLTVDALDRHYAAWLEGEDNDSETGSSHLIAAAWHMIALWWFHRHSRGTDDVRRVKEAQ